MHELWGSVLVALTVLIGCSGSATINGGTGNGGAGATSGGTTGGGTAGSGAVAGTGGSTGEGGAGGIDCPDIGCRKVCPAGQWIDETGCPTCACASELEMTVRGNVRPVQHLTFSGEVTDFIGGLDRWIFDFTWNYDDPSANDEAEDVVMQVAIQRFDPNSGPTEAHATWCHPDGSDRVYEDRGSTYTLHGIGVITDNLTIADGFLSARDNGQQQFEGYAYFDLTVNGGNPTTDTVHVAAPFTVPIPSP